MYTLLENIIFIKGKCRWLLSLCLYLFLAGCAKYDAGFTRNNPLDPDGTCWYPPAVTAMSDTSINVNDSFIITAKAIDNETVIKYIWARNGGIYSDTTHSGILKTAFSDTGEHIISVIAIDNKQIASRSDSCIVKITLDPPIVILMGDTVVSINDSITVTAAGKDNGTIKRYLWAKYGRVYSDTTTADSLKIAYPDSGRYVVRVIAIDDDGVYSLADSSIIRVTLGSPEVTSMHDTVVSLSTTSTALVNVQAKDINLGGSIQKYYWDINNNGWDDSTDSPSYMVASTAGGVVVVRWAVRDNDGLFTCDTFTVLFNRPPSSVTLTSPTSNTSWVTYDYSTGKGTLPLTLSATDPDGASDSLWFILFTGTASNSLIQIYSGKASSCTIPGIDSSSNVYYRLVVKDFFGDSGVCAGSFVAPFPLPPPPQGMVLIPAKDSSFSMGYDSWDMKPVHTVSFTHDFWMDTTEVTQNDFAALMGFNPSKFPLIIKGPVENVTWFDAALYCNKRSKRDGLDTVYTYTKKSMAGDSCTGLTGILTDYSKNGYRLPTEAEWEYACRAGTSTTYYWGSGDIDKYAWFNANSGATIRPVAQKLPNHFGLYDMSGNAWEWCNDYYGSYKSGAQTDPHGPLPYFECVIRGGAWNYNDDYLSSTNRSRNLPHNSSGFRCVRLQVI